MLITGASSGIGAAFADVFAANGFDLVITARREDRLHEAAERLERAYGRRVHVIACDLSRREAPPRTLRRDRVARADDRRARQQRRIWRAWHLRPRRRGSVMKRC